MADDRENCPKCGGGKLYPDPAASKSGTVVLKCAACGHELQVDGVPQWAPDSPESKARERRQLVATVIGGAVLVAIIVYLLH